jgi:hypothetical protein
LSIGFLRLGSAIMISDLDIWLTASEFIRKHDAEAEQEAVKLANSMLDRGDRAAQVEWLRVWMAIVLLKAQPPIATFLTGVARPTRLAL